MSHRSSSSSIISARLLSSMVLALAVIGSATASAQESPALAPAPAPAPATAPPPAPESWMAEPAPVPVPVPVDGAPAEVSEPQPSAIGTRSDTEAGAEAAVEAPGTNSVDASNRGAPLLGTAGPPPDDTADSYEKLPKYAQWHLGFEAGVRIMSVNDRSYDPYSSDDALTSLVLAATWIPLSWGPLSLGAIGEWSIGSSSGSARGDETSVAVQRGVVGAQGRLALGRRVYLHAKVAPGLVYAGSSIDDPALGRTLDAGALTWGLDATGGAAVLIARAGHPDHPAFRIWIVGELGYSFTGAAEMVHTPAEDEEDPRRFGELAMAPLDTSGVVNRFAVAMTF